MTVGSCSPWLLITLFLSHSHPRVFQTEENHKVKRSRGSSVLFSTRFTWKQNGDSNQQKAKGSSVIFLSPLLLGNRTDYYLFWRFLGIELSCYFWFSIVCRWRSVLCGVECEVLTRELAEDGYSGVEVRVTPMRTEIIIRATRTQNVLGNAIFLLCICCGFREGVGKQAQLLFWSLVILYLRL